MRQFARSRPPRNRPSPALLAALGLLFGLVTPVLTAAPAAAAPGFRMMVVGDSISQKSGG